MALLQAALPSELPQAATVPASAQRAGALMYVYIVPDLIGGVVRTYQERPIKPVYVFALVSTSNAS